MGRRSAVEGARGGRFQQVEGKEEGLSLVIEPVDGRVVDERLRGKGTVGGSTHTIPTTALFLSVASFTLGALVSLSLPSFRPPFS